MQYDITVTQEGGGVSKEITGSVLTTSMTSRLASVIFKMAGKVVVEEAVKNIEFYRKNLDLIS